MTVPPFHPSEVFLEIQMTCNLRCVQCDIWKLKNPADELTTDERRRVIAEVARWDPSIRLVLAGGEPFNRPSMLYAVGVALEPSNWEAKTGNRELCPKSAQPAQTGCRQSLSSSVSSVTFRTTLSWPIGLGGPVRPPSIPSSRSGGGSSDSSSRST